MNLEFLVLANVVLLTRLVLLWRDEAPSGAAWLAKGCVELAIAAICFDFSMVWCGVAATVAVTNGLGWMVDRRVRPKNGLRLLVGLIGLLALSVVGAPGAGLEFRAGLVEIGREASVRTAFAPLLLVAFSVPVQLGLFGLLLAANEANLAIRAAFDWLNLKPRMRRRGVELAQEFDVGEYNRGRVIGLLERALLYLFVLQGLYGAIGFVLAAKAFTRFKALDDRSFAEYVLIGTLLSACMALAVGGAVKWLLGGAGL